MGVFSIVFILCHLICCSQDQEKIGSQGYLKVQTWNYYDFLARNQLENESFCAARYTVSCNFALQYSTLHYYMLMSTVSTLLLIFSVICFCLALLPGIYKQQTYVSKIPKTKLVWEVILFTNNILHGHGIKHFPTYRILYYRHPKMAGYFRGNEIVVYLKNNDDIPMLINTVLHEVGHYIQSKTEQKEFKLYGEYSSKVGYYNNPFEVAARKFAAKWEKDCISHLIHKGVVKIEVK